VWYRLSGVPARIGRDPHGSLRAVANCLFCGHANGVFAFVRETAARTEQYWCPIRHAKGIRPPHARYQRFVDFGDAEGYRRRLPVLRAKLGPTEPPRDR
jgi:hypothetical protein